MAAVETNTIQIVQADTPTNGVIGDYKRIDLREITRLFNENTQEAAQNISRARQNIKSKITSTTSGVAYGAFFGVDVLDAVAQELFFSKVQNRAGNQIASTATSSANDEYTIGAATAEQVKLLKANSLLWVRGFNNSANNGLKVIETDVAANDTEVEVLDNLEHEAGVTKATLSFAGIRIAAGTAKTWAYANNSATLSSIGVGNRVGLKEGMFVYIGSIATEGGAIQNAFENAAANDIYGKARIRSISANSIVFDQLATTLERSDSSSPATAVDIVYGTFVTNTNQDSADYIRGVRTYEQTLPEFGANNATAYRYSEGNVIDTLSLAIPTDSYATCGVATQGTLTQEPTTVRRAGFADATDPKLRDTFVTGKDIARVSFSGDSAGYEITVFNMDWTLSNGLSRKNAVAVEGAWRINTANFTAGITMDVSLSDINFEGVIQGNEAVSITSVFQNTDGVIIPHIPSMTIARTGETYTAGDVVTVAGTSRSFEDPTFGTSASFSVWPVPFTRSQL